jgi:branched-chain amino acid transport system permease protein
VRIVRNLVIFLAGAAALVALPHGLSFSQQEILVFLTINILLVSSYRRWGMS